MAFVLFGIVTLRNLPGFLLLYGILLALFFISRIPLKIFSLNLLPSHLCHSFHLYFRVPNLFYSSHLSEGSLRIHWSGSSSGDHALSLDLFGILGRVLPSSFVTALFLTYRSIFILLNVLEETQHALYLRGGFQWRHPWRSLINISNAFGHLIIKGIDASEKMYESMVLRGFKNKIHYRGE